MCNGLGIAQGRHGIPQKGTRCNDKPHQSHLTRFAMNMDRGQVPRCTAESGVIIRLHVTLQRKTPVHGSIP